MCVCVCTMYVCIDCRERERNVLFNDALNTFYLRLYGVRHMVKDHSDSEKGNPLPPHRLLFPISSKGSFICTIPQTLCMYVLMYDYIYVCHVWLYIHLDINAPAYRIKSFWAPLLRIEPMAPIRPQLPASPANNSATETSLVCLNVCMYVCMNFNVFSFQTRIHYGCYSVFLKEWLDVFPLRHFLFLRTEDYNTNITSNLQTIYSFLELGK